MFMNVTTIPANVEVYDSETGIQATVLGIEPVYHRITGQLVADQVWVRLWVHGYGNELGHRWDIDLPYEAKLAYGTGRWIEIV